MHRATASLAALVLPDANPCLPLPPSVPHPSLCDEWGTQFRPDTVPLLW